MTAALIVVIVLLLAALAGLAVRGGERSGARGPRRLRLGAAGATAAVRRPVRAPAPGPATPRRILFPFLARALSEPALEAALRLAHAEQATLVPVFLARVGMQLPLDAPLPRQSAVAIPLQEAIEQRAVSFGVPVDTRIERGRTLRHALRETIKNERFDRIVVAAAGHGAVGLSADDVSWLLQTAPGEIVVLRPA